jgi:hypothetical protein
MNPNHDPKHGLRESAVPPPEEAPVPQHLQKLKDLFDGLVRLNDRWERCSFGDILASYILKDVNSQSECRREILATTSLAYQWSGEAPKQLETACFLLSAAQIVAPLSSIEATLVKVIDKFKRFNSERQQTDLSLLNAIDPETNLLNLPIPLNCHILQALKAGKIDLDSYYDPLQVEASTFYNKEVIARLEVFQAAVQSRLKAARQSLTALA